MSSNGGGGGHMNMRGVIGASFNEKKFGSVGSKLDNAKNMPLDKTRGGSANQLKKQKDNFQMSQVWLTKEQNQNLTNSSKKEKNESQQALIGKVAEMTTTTSGNTTGGATSPAATAVTAKFGELSLKNGAAGDGLSVSETPEQGATVDMVDGEEKPKSAENIVLNTEDRKRLTLADTAPKGGGIRRIITTDRS